MSSCQSVAGPRWVIVASAPDAGEEPQRSDARQEEVCPASHPDELRQALGTPPDAASLRDGKRIGDRAARDGLAVAHEGIALAAEAVELRADHPSILHELELP